MHGIKILSGIALLSAVLASGMTLLLTRGLTPHTVSEPTPQELNAHYYRVQNATLFDPRALKRALDQGGDSLVLVDIRRTSEYEKEHIVSALSVPAYTDDTTPAHDEGERIIGAFRTISLSNPSKSIVLYDYSATNEGARFVGELLSRNDIHVKQLSIGWNEWRYIKTLWNTESEWGSFDSEDYLTRGSEPGIPEKR